MLKWLLPVLLVALITPLTPAIDLFVSSQFYTKDTLQHHFVSSQCLDFIFKWGPLPTDIVAIVAAIVWLLSYCFQRCRRYRHAAAVLTLSLAIGSGLIVHAILKDHWGRPRPKQTIEFGGSQPFRAYYEPNFFQQPTPSKSFPCGHCSVGFYYFAIAILGMRYHSKAMVWIGFALAFIFGITLSYTRIAQGGHFFSDVMVSALIMWLTPLALDHWLYLKCETGS